MIHNIEQEFVNKYKNTIVCEPSGKTLEEMENNKQQPIKIAFTPDFF
jgi:hypothetical protein